jgi:hypothetical protein
MISRPSGAVISGDLVVSRRTTAATLPLRESVAVVVRSLDAF